MRRAHITYLAPSPRGFLGQRGWYLTKGERETVLAGPFPSESEAIAHARQRSLWVEA